MMFGKLKPVLFFCKRVTETQIFDLEKTFPNKCKYSCPWLKGRILSIETYPQSQHLNLQSQPTKVHLQRNCYYIQFQQVES